MVSLPDISKWGKVSDIFKNDGLNSCLSLINSQEISQLIKDNSNNEEKIN